MDLSGLNDKQREAALATEGPVLVLAGAGSGKTRVLTMRAAQLIENGVPAWQILAITFTNKAAAEMKQRIAAITDNDADMWVCTFHAMCAKLLRIESDRLGYDRSFSIYDAGDSLTVVKECLKELNVDKDFLDPRAARSLISKAKNAGVEPSKFRETYGEGDAMKYAAWAYARYEDKLKNSNALDFDDLDWERRKYRGFLVYCHTKLANVLFTRELARRLDGTPVTANAVHPGWVASNFAREGDMGPFIGACMVVAKPFSISSPAGALTSIYLASSPDVAEVSGQYFYKCRVAKPSNAALDDVAAARLWEVSAAMTGAPV
jgi:NAD(P)-dependent dehydrogenase (short-subunit alcohol dehydrogenase family)